MQHRRDDWDLLHDYVESGSGAAFTELVARHVDMVYSASLRQVRDPGLAEDVTQAVFIVLARKARRLPRETIISAWLHKTSRFTAINVLKAESRRERREQRAAQMNAEIRPHSSTWHSFEPLLDEGLSRLNETDRAAIVLRFFERRSLADVGAALQVSEDAAQMRVSRALEKLRSFFARKGVAVPAIALGGVISVNAVHAAPATLAPAVSAKALAVTNAAAGADAVEVDTYDDEIADATLRSLGWASVRRATLAVVLAVAAVFLIGVVLRNALMPRTPPSRPDPHQSAEVMSDSNGALLYVWHRR